MDVQVVFVGEVTKVFRVQHIVLKILLGVVCKRKIVVVTQQRIPIIAQLGFPIGVACVHLVDRKELSMPGIFFKARLILIFSKAN